ncbi:MAG: patatin-like phospholipase family protein, partial [Clostridia bacterium]
MKFIDFFKRKKTKSQEIFAIETKKNKIKAGLALGSGGTRGFAHLGVLKAFEDENIKFDYVAGTSAGSIVGALYSFGYSVDEMIEFASGLSIKDVKSSALIFMPSSAQPIEEVVRKFLGDVSFSDSKIPYSCVAVDLVTGDEVVMKDENLPKAVSASCAVPPFYRPVVWGDMHLIDGAFANPIPAKIVRDMGADIVVSVEVNST